MRVSETVASRQSQIGLMNSGCCCTPARMSGSGERPPRLRLMTSGEIPFTCACVPTSWTQVVKDELGKASAAPGSARAALSEYTVAPRTTKAAAVRYAGGRSMPALAHRRVEHVREDVRRHSGWQVGVEFVYFREAAAQHDYIRV